MENKQKTLDTYDKLLDSGKKFFLRYGYKSAPLRKIVADAGFTSGAFYGYFNNKEDLFYALTDKTAETFCNMLNKIINEINKLPDNVKIFKMNSVYIEYIPEIVDFLLQNRDSVKLILTCSEGTKYEYFFDKIEQNNISLISESAKTMPNCDNLSAYTLQVMMSGYFAMLSKVIVCETDRDKIISCMTEISKVYENGIISLITKE